MSWYYNYRLGYMKDGKIYPLAPFDAAGKWHDVFYRSRSFTSDLHEKFWPIKEEMVTDEFKKGFPWYEEASESEKGLVTYLPLKDLPTGSYIKSGYFLLEDIKAYEEYHGTDDIFYDSLTEKEYLRLMKNELLFGKPQEKEDDFGETYTPKSCADYAFYAYPDYFCEEYEAFLLRTAAEPYEYTDLVKNTEQIVVILHQG